MDERESETWRFAKQEINSSYGIHSKIAVTIRDAFMRYLQVLSSKNVDRLCIRCKINEYNKYININKTIKQNYVQGDDIYKRIQAASSGEQLIRQGIRALGIEELQPEIVAYLLLRFLGEDCGTGGDLVKLRLEITRFVVGSHVAVLLGRTRAYEVVLVFHSLNEMIKRLSRTVRRLLTIQEGLGALELLLARGQLALSNPAVDLGLISAFPSDSTGITERLRSFRAIAPQRSRGRATFFATYRIACDSR